MNWRVHCDGPEAHVEEVDEPADHSVVWHDWITARNEALRYLRRQRDAYAVAVRELRYWRPERDQVSP